MAKYNRVIIKISGEALSTNKFGIQNQAVEVVAQQIKSVVDKGVSVGIVIGGGNFWRGRTSESMDRAKADYIGMLATVMNGVALGEALSAIGIKNHVVSSLAIDKVCETFFLPNVLNYMDNNEVVIFVGGTGNPYFSTDSAASLRACEVHADAILCAKAVDGIYDSDPSVNPSAKKYDEISYDKVIADNLKAMDLTSIAMCREYGVKLVVFSKDEENGLARVIDGENLGTIVK